MLKCLFSGRFYKAVNSRICNAACNVLICTGQNCSSIKDKYFVLGLAIEICGYWFQLKA